MAFSLSLGARLRGEPAVQAVGSRAATANANLNPTWIDARLALIGAGPSLQAARGKGERI
jgi:hypothetical protein